LIPKGDGGIFSDNFADAFDHVDLTDLVTEAEGVRETEIDPERLQHLLNEWSVLVKEKIPEKEGPALWNGGWQVHWGDLFDRKAENAQAAMLSVMSQIAEGKTELSELKPAFVDWIVARVIYYRSGVPVPQSAERLKIFR
jgi:hypothetical protein